MKKNRRRTESADDLSLEAGGQSGDTQGLSGVATANSESVKELVEEGQYFEAAVVSGVENAPDADVSEVTTKEVPQDEIPGEQPLPPNIDVQ
jgi:hypothetical protein